MREQLHWAFGSLLLAAVGGCGGVAESPETGLTTATHAGSDARVEVTGSDPDWPMPNPKNGGLPHPTRYDTASPGLVVDDVTRLTWQRSLDAGPSAWAEANSYCEQLELAGLSDWSLPSYVELVSLLDYTRRAPAIDCQAFPNTPSRAFWSASPFIGAEIASAWSVDFDSGYASGVPATDDVKQAVRCVHHGSARGAQRSPTARFISSAASVTDTESGLTWQAQAAQGGNFEAATSYCAALTLDGHDDWRLPSMKEALSLLDVSRAAPNLDTLTFPGEPYALRTSSEYAEDPSFVWTVHFDGQGVYLHEKSATFEPWRCLR